MFKQITVGEVKIGERVYSFSCDPQSPLGEIHDAILQFHSFVLERMQATQKEMAAKNSEQQPEAAPIESA